MTSIEGELTRERALTLHRHAGGTRAWLAWTLTHLGDFDAALTCGREAVRIAELRDDRLSQVVAFGYLALVHLGRGEFAAGIPLLQRALGLCRSYDLADWLAPVMMHLGYAYAQTGRLDEGLSLQEAGCAHAEAIRGLTGHAARLAALAQSYSLARRWADAAETARRGLALAEDERQPHGAAACLRVLGVIAAYDTADIASAESYLTQAHRIASSVEMRPLVAHCHADLGALYGRYGKYVEAREHLAGATAMYRDMGMDFWTARTDAEIVRLDA
jgi:tetratricopeptide (TPR) repeat protein